MFELLLNVYQSVTVHKVYRQQCIRRANKVSVLIIKAPALLPLDCGETHLIDEQ